MNHLRTFLSTIAICAVALCSAQLADPEGLHAREQKQASAHASLPQTNANAKLSYVLTDAPNGTFGYDILSDGKLFVRQLNIPGQPGNNGCATKADAQKLAQLVIEKIRKGTMPPTVTKEELIGLNIIQ